MRVWQCPSSSLYWVYSLYSLAIFPQICHLVGRVRHQVVNALAVKPWCAMGVEGMTPNNPRCVRVRVRARVRDKTCKCDWCISVFLFLQMCLLCCSQVSIDPSTAGFTALIDLLSISNHNKLNETSMMVEFDGWMNDDNWQLRTIDGWMADNHSLYL